MDSASKSRVCSFRVPTFAAFWLCLAPFARAADAPAPPPVPQPVTEGLALAQTGSTMTVPGVDGWLFLDKELRHATAPRFWGAGPDGAPLPGDPLPAILDFKQQLDSVGVDLLVVPVPPKCLIYPDKLAASISAPPPLPKGFGENDREFYKTLESHGVAVLDLTDAFVAARADSPEPLYCQQDSHWAPAGIQIAATEIAKRIKGKDGLDAVPKVPLKSFVAPVTVNGDLAAVLPGQKPTPQVVSARFVSPTDAPDNQPLPPSKTSPVVLLGDSHNLVFHAGGDMQAAGAGLPDQLALELGFPVDVVAVRGSGATPARRNLARRKDNLAGRRTVIWCFSAREFTEGQGWSKVPVVKKPAGQSGP